MEDAGIKDAGSIESLMEEIRDSQRVIDEQNKRIQKLMERLAEAEIESVEPTEEVKETARKMGPMDDLFFNKVGKDKGSIEEIISTIAGIKVDVLDVIPQYFITGLENRSVRLDSMSSVVPQALVKVRLDEDSPFGPKGAKVNIEVQKENNDDHQFRVYYNGASIIVNETPKGCRFEDISRAVVIFISSFDVFKGGRMVYETQLTTKQDGIVGRRPVAEYYVNTKVVDRSTPHNERIADLMRLFADADAYDEENFPCFSKRKYELKHIEEEVLKVSKEVQDLIDKGADAREQKTTVDHIRNMMVNLKLTLEQAMDALGIPQDKRSIYAGLVNGGRR